MHAYAQRNGFQVSQLRFLFDGLRIMGHQTPADLDMEDQDVLDVMIDP